MQNKIIMGLSQIHRALGRNFSFFREYYFEHYHSCPQAAFHLEMTELLSEASKHRGARLALAAPRGSAKSTLITLEYVLYCICYSTDLFILVISSTAGQSEGFLNDIKKELENNLRLIEDFPEICEIGKKPGPPRWRRNEIVTRNHIRVLALSPGQQIRGRRNRQVRPSLIILDDVETDEKIQSAEQFDKLQDWLTKTVLKLGNAQTNIILTGTIHHYHSLLAQYVDPKSNPGWTKKIYRSVISWSSQNKLWETWSKIFSYHERFEDQDGPDAARKFFEAHQEAMLKDTAVLWPESKSYYDLMVMRETDGYASFDSEMQNEPVNPRDCYFNLDELHYWEDDFSSEEELLQVLGRSAEFYGACDPSLGKSGREGDYSAIVIIVKNSAKGTMYVLDADIERRLPDKTIEDILAYCRYRKCSRFGFETNQFQEFMKTELEKRARTKGISLIVDPVEHTSNKLLRIQALQPLVKSGAIRFSRKHRTLLEQLKYFPKGSHDDGPDALEMVVNLSETPQPRIWWI